MPTGPIIRNPSRLPDDRLFSLGTDRDIVFLNRAATLAADTTLANVIIGTPVVEAMPANSFIKSHITANGDMVWLLNDGAGNSWEYLRFDSSADLIAFNAGASDIDLTIEADSNANLAVFDAGLNGGVGQVAFGGAASTGAFFRILQQAITQPNTDDNWHRAFISSSGALTVPTGTTSPTITSVRITEPNITLAGTGAVTNAATLQIADIATEATNNAGIAVRGGSVTAVGIGGFDGTDIDANTGILWPGADLMAIATGGTERMRFRVNGVVMGGTSVFSTAGTNNIVLIEGTAPSGTLTDGGALYVRDAAGVTELSYIDSGGAVTNVS